MKGVTTTNLNNNGVRNGGIIIAFIAGGPRSVSEDCVGVLHKLSRGWCREARHGGAEGRDGSFV